MHVLVEKLLVVKIKKNMKLNVKKLVFIINLFFKLKYLLFQIIFTLMGCLLLLFQLSF